MFLKEEKTMDKKIPWVKILINLKWSICKQTENCAICVAGLHTKMYTLHRTDMLYKGTVGEEDRLAKNQDSESNLSNR